MPFSLDILPRLQPDQTSYDHSSAQYLTQSHLSMTLAVDQSTRLSLWANTDFAALLWAGLHSQQWEQQMVHRLHPSLH